MLSLELLTIWGNIWLAAILLMIGLAIHAYFRDGHW